MSTASAYGRLRNLFKTTNTRPTKTIQSKAPPTACDVSLPPPKSTGGSYENKWRAIVTEFKKCSNSDHFRREANRAYEKTVFRLAGAKKFSHIEEILEYQKKFKNIADEAFAIRIMRLYGKAGMFDHARKLFDEMPQLNCERTVRSFNALLGASVNSRKFDQVTQLLADLPEKLSLKPNVVTYNTVLKALCEQGSLDLAVSVIDKMEEAGLQPDVISFNTLLDAFSQNRKIAEAEKVWGMMEDKNVAPNVRSYNPMLRALVADNRVAEAVKLFEEMKSKDIQPNSISFNAFINGCLDEGNLEEAKSWHEKMKKENCSPDHHTFTLLIQLACNKCDFVYALELCEESIRRRRFLQTPLLQLVVDGLVRGHKMEEAKELIELGKSNGVFVYNLEMPSAG